MIPPDFLVWSDLSAAYFELGDYTRSIVCGVYAQGIAEENRESANVDLLTKLVTRLLKAHLHTHQYVKVKSLLASYPNLPYRKKPYRVALYHGKAIWDTCQDETKYRMAMRKHLPRYRPPM